MSRQSEELWLDLRVNDRYICSIYAYTDYEWADAGNTAIVHLSAGDNVTVTAHAGLENHLFGSSDHIFTTFSGAQIISDAELRNPGTSKSILYSYYTYACYISLMRL